jgi:transposase
MSKTRPPYAPEFRQQMVELVRAGRSAEELARAAFPIIPPRCPTGSAPWMRILHPRAGQTHDSGPAWVASPSPYGSSIRNSSPASRRTGQYIVFERTDPPPSIAASKTIYCPQFCPQFCPERPVGAGPHVPTHPAPPRGAPDRILRRPLRRNSRLDALLRTAGRRRWLIGRAYSKPYVEHKHPYITFPCLVGEACLDCGAALG